MKIVFLKKRSFICVSNIRSKETLGKHSALLLIANIKKSKISRNRRIFFSSKAKEKKLYSKNHSHRSSRWYSTIRGV